MSFFFPYIFNLFWKLVQLIIVALYTIVCLYYYYNVIRLDFIFDFEPLYYKSQKSILLYVTGTKYYGNCYSREWHETVNH